MLPEFSDKELFHLAVDSARYQRHDSSVRYLKALLSRQPEHVEANYLLGAAYASLGMMEEAEEQLSKAITLAPAMDIARFQLALVQLGQNKVEQAKDVLLPLIEITQTHYLNDYARGIHKMVAEDHGAAQQHLQLGISKNHDNPALNADIQGILDAINSGKSGDQPTTAITPAESNEDLLAADYLLGVYKQ